MITLYDKGSHIPLLWTHLIPATLEGRALHNVQNAMVAAAMAFSLGIKLDAIRQGLRTFDTTFFQAPGRMNVFNEHPFKVLFDYGHNAHAVGVMADLAQRLDVVGRRIVVLAGPGDRRDEDLRAIAEAVAGRFDHYICRRDDSLRGRDGDEVPRIIAKALQATGVPEDAISIIPDEQEAIDAALRMGQPGDLLLVFADALTRSWKQIIKFRPEGEALRPVARVETPALEPMLDEALDAVMEGVVRDERGLHFARSERLTPRRMPGHATDAERVMPSEPPFDDSRRLTGRNLYFDGPARCSRRWARRARRGGAVGMARRHRRRARRAGLAAGRDRGASARQRCSLAFAAPADQLYTATEINEWAWLASLHALQPVEPRRLHAPGDPAAWDRRFGVAHAARDGRGRSHPACRAAGRRAGARRARACRRRRAVHRRGRRQPHWPMHALPAVDECPGPRCTASRWRGHRLQRQDHHRAPARGDAAGAGLAQRLQLHRRAVRRRRARRQRRLFRPGRRAHGAAPPTVDAAILETARGGLLRRGLAVPTRDVAVVTNVSADHFGEYGIHDLDDLAAGQAHRRPRAGAGWRAGAQRRRPAAGAARAARWPLRIGWFALDHDHPPCARTAPTAADLRRARRPPAACRALVARTTSARSRRCRSRSAAARGYNIANAAAAALAAPCWASPRAHRRRARALRRAARRQPRPPAALALGGGSSAAACRCSSTTRTTPTACAACCRSPARPRGGRLGLLLGQAGNREDATSARWPRGGRSGRTGCGSRTSTAFCAAARPAKWPRSCATSCAAGPAGSRAGGVPGGNPGRARALAWAQPGDVLVLPVHDPARARRAVTLLDRPQAGHWRAGTALPDA